MLNHTLTIIEIYHNNLKDNNVLKLKILDQIDNTMSILTT